MYYRISLYAETPLTFRSGRDAACSSTHEYVPGISLIGGLAQAHQALRRNPEEFAAFFLHNRIQFGNCYPALFAATALQADNYPVLPLPLTARSCKRFPGFVFHAENERKHRAGVTDLLIPLALFALSGEQRGDLLDQYQKHPRTNEPLDRLEGFFRRGSQADHYGQPRQRKALRTRTGINYDTGIAQSAILYSREVLERGTKFWGCWHVDDDLTEAFAQFVTEVDKGDLLRVGNNRTRGSGHVRFNLQRIDEDTELDLKARIEAFTQHFKQQAATSQLDAPAALYVPILLTSDAILTDPLLRARLQISADDLAAIGIPGAELVFQAAGMRQVSSWNSLWGLPRADDWAITKGSVFLFALPEANNATFAALLNWQRDGIGQRRTEGFGALTLAHRFHIELAGVYR